MVKIDDMVTIAVTPIDKSTIVFTEDTREWCKLPYPTRDEHGKKLKKSKIAHPNGCDDNYGKCETCPPKTPYRIDILDTYSHFVLVHATFDIQKYIEEMRELHPDWTDKQLRNLLYWQGQLKAKLKDKLKELEYDELFGAGSGFMGRPSMEASGIFVFATFQRNGIKFDKNARKFVKMVCLLVSRGKKPERRKSKSTLLDFLDQK